MASNHNSANSVNVNSKDMLWILNEAKNLLKTDVYAAKTWLLVGKTLLPWCFQIRVGWMFVSLSWGWFDLITLRFNYLKSPPCISNKLVMSENN